MTKRRTLDDFEWANRGVIKVQYEIPPMRAIYECWFADDSHTDEEVRLAIESMYPSWRILKISRHELPDGECSDDQTQNA